MESKPKKGLRWEEIQDQVILAAAGAASVVLLYFMFFYTAPVSVKDSRIVGEIRTVKKVRRRHSDTLSWENLKGAEAIYLRDIVFIPRGTTATIALPSGKNVELPEDTMIQFDDTTIENMEITLENFRLLPLKSPSGKMNPLLDDIKPLELRHNELTSRMYDQVFRDLNLGRVDRIDKLKLELGNLGDYELNLVAPVEGRYNLRANRWVKMAWTPIPLEGVNFRLEVSKDPKFRKSLPYKTNNNRLQVQFDEEATYYWRVKATHKGNELVSKLANFTMSLRGGQTPKRITLRLPTVATTNFAIEVSAEKDFASLLKSTLVPEAKCPVDGLPPGKYYCRVRNSATDKLVKSYDFDVK